MLSYPQQSNSFDVLFESGSFKIFNTSLLVIAGVATGACHYGHLSHSNAGLIHLPSKLKRIIQLSAATVYHMLLALWFLGSGHLQRDSSYATAPPSPLLREINEEFPLPWRSRL